MTIADLPALNAALNSLATLFLVVGWVCIRARRIALHRAAMLAAFAASAAFLASYLVYHYHIGSKPFGGTGTIRLVYFSILTENYSQVGALTTPSPAAGVPFALGLMGARRRRRKSC